jgi:DNA-binding transcriptional MocR family regulator
MRTEYRARLEGLADAAVRFCGGALTLRPVATGLHAIADLHAADDDVVFREAMARGVETMPLSAYCFDRRSSQPSALVLGFASVRPEQLAGGMERLAAAIEAAQRAGRGRRRRAAG